MIDRNSSEANAYMKEYRKKIREKHLSNKTTKTEILNALSKEERTPNKEKEINERYKADIKNFVNGLKLDENFAIYQKKYHEDIQEIRKLVYADSEAQKNKGLRNQRNFITKLFPEAKEAAFRSDYEWNSFVDKLSTDMVKLKKEEKVKVLSSLTEMFRNKESIIKAFNEIKNGLKNTDTPERVVYISLTLVALVIAGLGITMLDEQTNHLIVKMLGALRFVNGVKGAGKSVKEAIIAGGKNEARNIANSHTYDNTNHKDLFGNKRDRLNNIVSE